MLVSHKRILYNFGIEVKIADISYNGAVYFYARDFYRIFYTKERTAAAKNISVAG